MRALYNALFALWTIVILPRTLYHYLFQKKYRGNLLYRLGLKSPSFPVKKGMRIWIHAVSLGETKAVGPLMDKIKKEWPQVEIFFSSTTETGHREAKEKQKAIDFCFFLPLDFPLLMRNTVRLIAPDVFILVETDFWLNLLTELKRHETKIALVNGKVSERSYRKFRAYPAFARELFGQIDLFCLQNEEYKERFLGLGVPEKKISVTGNLKFDMPRIVTPQFNIYLPEARKCVTIACTHENEEEMILDALHGLDVCLLLAPRHPERFPAVAKMLERKGIAFRKIAESGTGSEKVVLVDRMGVLDQCYEISKVAIMGGSFIPTVGGHNIYEPVRYGIPVIYGPHMHKQPDLVDSLQRHNIGKQIELKELHSTLSGYLTLQPDKAAYARLKSEMEGATERTFNLIKLL